MQQSNWNHWFAVWTSISRRMPITLKTFCEREKLDLECARKAFARRDKAGSGSGHKARKDASGTWGALRLEFLAGDWQTLADFARARGLKSETGYFSKRTKGWLAERAEIKAKNRVDSVTAIAQQKENEAIARLHARILIALYKCQEGYERILGFLRAEKEHGPRELKDVAATIRTIQAGLQELFPMIRDFEESENSKALIQKLIAGEIDVTEAALKYAEMGGNLPKAVEILLGKVQPEEAEPKVGEIPTDEELEARYQAGLARIRREESDFVPRRQREVEGLKIASKDADSFGRDILNGGIN